MSHFSFRSQALILVLGVAATAGCQREETVDVAARANASRITETQETKTEVKQTTISVKGMSCVSCVARVQQKLISTAGVQAAEVDLQNNEARVRHDAAKVTPERLTAIVNDLGYEAKLAAPPKK